MKHRQRKPVNDRQKANVIRPSPRNERQADYIHAIEHSPQVFALGPAGTGKTFIAASMAAYLYLTGEIRQIILVRPAVAAGGEAHGFLPGDLNKKLAPWTFPIIEILEECLGKERVLMMIKDDEIRTEPFTYMRGRTWMDAFIILDEAENTTPAQMELFLTRVGEGSRVVVDGDLAQSDLSGESGLGMALRLLRRYPIDAEVIEFTMDDVERSGICQQWVRAFAGEKVIPITIVKT